MGRFSFADGVLLLLRRVALVTALSCFRGGVEVGVVEEQGEQVEVVPARVSLTGITTPWNVEEEEE